MPLVDAEKELGWEKKRWSHTPYWVVPHEYFGEDLIAYCEDFEDLDKIHLEDIPRFLLGEPSPGLLRRTKLSFWGRNIEEEMINPYLAKRLELGT